jgi:hypothetical protein
MAYVIDLASPLHVGFGAGYASESSKELFRLGVDRVEGRFGRQLWATCGNVETDKALRAARSGTSASASQTFFSRRFFVREERPGLNSEAQNICGLCKKDRESNEGQVRHDSPKIVESTGTVDGVVGVRLWKKGG